ncbi:MAG: Peptidase M16 domain protein [Parcubacteria group bacterium GW2011_GWC2_45_7]|nr:MAG: Peptidase M16 domain protein [Parcubacteria group bacterium GW2011_GWC2_45_7]KKU73043.1 MAG: Peptidase M16 domain protein [Parcubacteria group bacterium GW2011_GWA2_47_26]
MSEIFEKRVLKNGVRTILVPLSSTKAVTLLVLFRVGSRYETENINGIAHFVEHMMFKGTKKRPTTLHISKALDRYGAEYNAFTSKDHTGYYIKISREKLSEAMDILFDMLLNSKIAAEEVDRERKVIFEEIKMYEENPLLHIENIFESALFQGSTLGWNIAGTKESMSKITQQDIVEFVRNYYVPARALVVVCGNLDEHVFKDVETGLRAMRAPASRPRQWQRWRGSIGQKLNLQYKDLEQTQLMLGWPAYKYGDERANALSILHAVLGGTMSSRLFVAVRERRGLAYSVRTDIGMYEDTGVFAVHAGLDAGRLKEAIKVIRAELARIVKSGVTAGELEDAKNTIKGRTVLQLEETNDLAGWYARQELFFGKVETPEERFKKLDAVRREDVLAAARDIICLPRMAAAVIGPFKDERVLIKYLFGA